ncbi:hypothetical protein L0U85_01930 [Glycomyces sp. L485]|uniref:hypothetical protein n=1 Tax=Glycomyces sp. L485 TaxID=2909235 RepID=UPI001F4A6D54|nr:hypothetical protein [Glycomyces sp. L485]MCH7229626.1 hypothetical protein [Glycomyces sp. L485]
MPKAPHEALHHLFRDDPDLVRRALKECLDEDFPRFRSVALIDSDPTEIKAITREVDTALMVETDEGAEILIIEPQSKPPTQAKIRAWHWYLSYFEAHFDVAATLIIITAEKATATSCRRPMTLGPERRASATVHPFVIGPDNTPFITEKAQAAEDVMLAVFAALAHRRDPGIHAALDTLAEVLVDIDLESAKFFAEYVEIGLGEGSARKHWRSIIMATTYPLRSELRREFEERGEERGMYKGQATMLFELLAARGIELSQSQRELVSVCEDEATFLLWLRRALSADSADEVFTSPDA